MEREYYSSSKLPGRDCFLWSVFKNSSYFAFSGCFTFLSWRRSDIKTCNNSNRLKRGKLLTWTNLSICLFVSDGNNIFSLFIAMVLEIAELHLKFSPESNKSNFPLRLSRAFYKKYNNRWGKWASAEFFFWFKGKTIVFFHDNRWHSWFKCRFLLWNTSVYHYVGSDILTS